MKASGFDCGEMESPRFTFATSTWDPSGSLLATLHDHCRLETLATVHSALPFSLTVRETTALSSSSSSSSSWSPSSPCPVPLPR